ncbi:carboxynorspermidine decarboxylase [bacterium]|jgi:carboxynorspermidine decarboxylase|nr:carboxynorspermidine decarboxylase [bacterium]
MSTRTPKLSTTKIAGKKKAIQNPDVLNKISTPAYVIDEDLLEKNLKILSYIQNATNCEILLALKAFSTSACFPLIKRYLSGVTASSLNEAKLGSEEFGKNVHVYSPAYTPATFKKLLNYSSHIVMNSFAQWKRLKHLASLSETLKIGIRVNPHYSEVKNTMYNPCSLSSRFGVSSETLNSENLDGISGLHFHALCQQPFEVLERVWSEIESKFEQALYQLSWVNLGGGHYLTHPDYDIKKLITFVNKIQKKYNISVYMEPGEAVVYKSGFLVTSVLDLGDSNPSYAIVDVSASAHMPDILEMPYRPTILNECSESNNNFKYSIGGPTCLSGDIIGNYSFSDKLKIGDKLVLTDMAQYTIVKNTTFNGIDLPSILLLKSDGELKLIKNFTYTDFKSRVG